MKKLIIAAIVLASFVGCQSKPSSTEDVIVDSVAVDSTAADSSLLDITLHAPADSSVDTLK